MRKVFLANALGLGVPSQKAGVKRALQTKYGDQLRKEKEVCVGMLHKCQIRIIYTGGVCVFAITDPRTFDCVQNIYCVSGSLLRDKGSAECVGI